MLLPFSKASLRNFIGVPNKSNGMDDRVYWFGFYYLTLTCIELSLVFLQKKCLALPWGWWPIRLPDLQTFACPTCKKLCSPQSSLVHLRWSTSRCIYLHHVFSRISGSECSMRWCQVRCWESFLKRQPNHGISRPIPSPAHSPSSPRIVSHSGSSPWISDEQK